MDKPQKPYHSLLRQGSATYVDKRSKFIAAAASVYSEEEAAAFLEEQRTQYKDANHHVYAYRLGPAASRPNLLERFSDDGEPSGTAGMPALDVLRGRQLENAIIVVTRYFGGTLLGTGGLVHAYGHSAGQAVEAAVPIKKIPCQKISVTVSYPASGKVQYEALQANGVIVDIVYREDVTFVMVWEADALDGFIKKASDLTSGHIEVQFLEDLFGTSHAGKAVFFER